jgi:methyl-accepting chemotaxis protein
MICNFRGEYKLKLRFGRFSSLQTKIISVCLIFLAVPSLIIGIIGYNLAKNELDASGMVQLKNDVRFTIELIHNLDLEVKKGNLTLPDAQEMVKESILGKKGADGKRPINKKFDLGEFGYLSAYDQKGHTLAHPTSEGQDLWNSQSTDGTMVLQDLTQQALSGGGYITYLWPLPTDPNKESEKITYSEVAPEWGWVVSAGSYMVDFNRGSQSILYLLLITLGASLAVGSVAVFVFGRSISRPLKQMSTQAASVTKGDLTIEPLVVKNRDEIGLLANDFNLMVATLKDMVKQISFSANQIAAFSEELTASALQTAEASEHTASTMQQLAIGTETQVTSIEETDKTIKEFASEIQHIVSSAQTVSHTADQSSEVAQEGNQVIQTAVARMTRLGEEVGSLSETMTGLGEHAQNIGAVVEAISGIAKQTNLLHPQRGD